MAVYRVNEKILKESGLWVQRNLTYSDYWYCGNGGRSWVSEDSDHIDTWPTKEEAVADGKENYKKSFKYGRDWDVVQLDDSQVKESKKLRSALSTKSTSRTIKDELLRESVDNSYRVYQICMDVAVPGGQDISAYGLSSSGNGKLFHALSQALESEGLAMAGDFIFADDNYEDLTATYKDNDYEFFEESFRTRRG